MSVLSEDMSSDRVIVVASSLFCVMLALSCNRSELLNDLAQTPDAEVWYGTYTRIALLRIQGTPRFARGVFHFSQAAKTPHGDEVGSVTPDWLMSHEAIPTEETLPATTSEANLCALPTER